jgi:RNA polymerase sigma factor (sigma-70 family)
MARTPNRVIVQELRDGNRLGCVHLVEVYHRRLLDEAIHTFHVPKLDAEELVSDVLLCVVENIHNFQFRHSDGDLHYWLMTIFRNRVRDFFRRQAITEGLFETFQESMLDAVDEAHTVEREVALAIVRNFEHSLRFSGNGSEQQNETAHKLQMIAECLDRLEAWERVLLRCRALNIPYESISRYTGKSVKQLKVYHARVKKRFIKLLAEHFPELQKV